jgi:tetratricopeptide (TPR) repeat protein
MARLSGSQIHQPARYKWTVQKMTYKIQQEPDDGEWYFERGKALMGLNQYQEAIPDFSKLIEIYPTGGGYYELRGLCYFHVGDKVNALADLRQYKIYRNKNASIKDTIKTLDELEKEL